MNRTICANPCCTHPFAYLISAPVNATTPRVSGLVGSLRRANSKRICVSLTEAQYQTLNQRERELNLGRSRLVQLLIEAEQDQPRLRSEILRRLRRPSTDNNPTTKGPHDSE